MLISAAVLEGGAGAREAHHDLCGYAMQEACAYSHHLSPAKDFTVHMFSRSFLIAIAFVCGMAAMPAQASRYTLYQASCSIATVPAVFLVAAGITFIADSACSEREARVLARAMHDAEGMVRQDCACQHIRALKRKKRVAQQYAGAALITGIGSLALGAYLLNKCSN